MWLSFNFLSSLCCLSLHWAWYSGTPILVSPFSQKAGSCLLGPAHCLEAWCVSLSVSPSSSRLLFLMAPGMLPSVLGPPGASDHLGWGTSFTAVCASNLPQSVLYIVLRVVLINASLGLSEPSWVTHLTKCLFFFFLHYPSPAYLPYFILLALLIPWPFLKRTMFTPNSMSLHILVPSP